MLEPLIIETDLDKLQEVNEQLLNKQSVLIEVFTGIRVDKFWFKWDDLNETYFVNINGPLAVGSSIEFFKAIIMAYYS